MSEYKSGNIFSEIVYLLATSRHYVDDNDEFKSYVKEHAPDYKTKQWSIICNYFVNGQKYDLI